MADIPILGAELCEKYEALNNTLFNDVKKDKKDKIDVEVGDSKQSDFKPQVKIKRWDNEVNFSMRAEEDENATVEIDGEKIKYIASDFEVHQYDKPDVSSDGGYEFEWVLPEDPSTNILRATIETKGLIFYYQPILNNPAERPENVDGSYAVYHSSKGGVNDAAGNEYKAGKAFHIYRPKVTDADGKETWGVLNIDVVEKELTVTVDDKFLKKAKYPVVVDPTFGYETKGASTTGTNVNTAIFVSARPMDGNGSVTKISAELSGTTSGNIKAAIFNVHGRDLLTNGVGNGASFAGSGDEFVESSFGTSPSVINGKYYYAAIIPDAEFLIYYDSTGHASGGQESNDYTTPTDLGYINAQGDAIRTIYATYTADDADLDQKSFMFFDDGDELPHYDPGTCPLVETADVTQSSGTGTAATVSYPSYVSGDLMLMYLHSDDDQVFTPPSSGPNSETINYLMTTAASTAGPTIAGIWWVGTGTESASTLSWTIDASEEWQGTCVKVPDGEFDPQKPVDSISDVSFSASGSAVPTPVWYTDRAGGRVLVSTAVDSDPLNAVASGWTRVYTNDMGALSSTISTRTAATTLGETISSVNHTTISDTTLSLGLVINAPRTADGRTIKGTVGADPTLAVATDFGWHFRIENASGPSTEDSFKIQYKHTEGTNTWTDVSSSSSVIKAVASSDFANGDDVFERIGGELNYVSANNAGLESAGSFTLDDDLGGMSAFEGHLNFQIVAADVADEDTIQLRVVLGDGTALDSYTDIPTITVDEAATGSASLSPSFSPSVSPSASFSPSFSPSISPSPSVGWEGYTRGDYAALPANDDDLENSYSAGDYTDVNTSNGTRVDQTGTDEYMIHEFKDWVGSETKCTLKWEGQSTLAASTATVYLQAYNQDTPGWELIDSNSTTTANTDFILIGGIADLTDYKSSENTISCRIYQLAE